MRTPLRQTVRQTVRLIVLLIAPLALLTACSSGSSTRPQSLDATSTSSASAAATHGSAATPRSTSAPDRPEASSSASAVPGAAVPASAAPLSTRAPGKPAASKATTAGQYTYTSSGTVTVGTTPQDAAGTQTLTISALKGDLQHSTLHSDDTGDTDQDVVVRDSGSYGASLKLASPVFNKEFRPATPVLLVPDPAVVGRSWSWSATSTDGATHVSAANKLVRTQTLTIGGTKVSTVVLQTHLVLSGDVRYDAQLTVWWAPAYRLPVKTHTVGKGSYGGIPFKTDVTAVMNSVEPS